MMTRDGKPVWREYPFEEPPEPLPLTEEERFERANRWRWWGDRRHSWHYPTHDDLQRLQAVYPNVDITAPDWPRIRAELIASGVPPSELIRITSPDLVAMAYGRIKAVAAESSSAAPDELNQSENADQPDNKTDNSKKSAKNPVPSNPDVLKLAKYMKRQWKQRPSESKISLALEFTDGNRRKAESLLRQLQRFKNLLD